MNGGLFGCTCFALCMILIQQPPIQQQLPENEVQPIVSKEQAAFPNEGKQLVKTLIVSSLAWSLTTATITTMPKKEAAYLISGHKDSTISFWTSSSQNNNNHTYFDSHTI